MDDLNYPQQLSRSHKTEKPKLGEDRREQYMKKMSMHNNDGLAELVESMEPI